MTLPPLSLVTNLTIGAPHFRAPSLPLVPRLNPQVLSRPQARSLEPASAYMQEFPDDKTWQNVLVGIESSGSLARPSDTCCSLKPKT